jgi:hypothetical protein
MTSRVEDVGRAPMARESSSSSCASPASGGAPYLRVMKTQLNFFMTRLLFMQEEKADSLGARATNARRMNNSGNLGSNSSLNFNNSASRVEGQQGQPGQHGQHGTKNAHLLGPMEEDELGCDDVLCIYSDNARILPNSVAKSMPAVPFPPAAPESPRPVETKDGIIMMAPSHHSFTGGAASGLPEALPLGDMALEDHDHDNDNDDDDDSYSEDDENAPDLEEVVEEDLMIDTDTEHTSATASTRETERKPRARSKSIPSVPAVPMEQRVFPKNRRRSKRGAERAPISRSHSDVSDRDDASNQHMSSSLH